MKHLSMYENVENEVCRMWADQNLLNVILNVIVVLRFVMAVPHLILFLWI